MLSRLIAVAILLFFSCLFSKISLGQENKKIFDRHGRVVKPVIDLERGTVKSIAGFKENIKDYGLNKSDLNDETVKALAKKIIEDYSEISKVKYENLKLTRISNSADRWSVRFQVNYHDIPIEFTHVELGIKKWGEIDGPYYRHFNMPEMSTTPCIQSEEARSITRIHKYGQDTVRMDRVYRRASTPELIIYPQKKDSAFVFYLAWKINLYGIIYCINAQDGSIIFIFDYNVY